jgi:predicted transcriptional regulator
VDKAKLLAKRGQSFRDIEVDVGTVRVRGLNRVEAKAVGEVEDQNAKEVKLIALALVDPEGMTEEEVTEWLNDAPAGDFVRVLEAVTELSGFDKEAAKSV